MSTTAADVLVDCLVACNVQVVFGLPGDGINGIMEALRQRQRDIRFIQVRHEESAAFMACAYAKLTGKLGVCLATSGPGGIHLLNGLYDAKLDGAPVLAITGLQFHDLVHTHTQQDVELDKLFADVCVYNARIMGPAHVENVMELACRTALARRGVAHVTMPVDMQSMPLTSDARSERNVKHHVSMVAADGMPVPDAAELQRAAAILNAGKKNLHPGRPRRAPCQGGAGGAGREAARPGRQGAARQGRHGGHASALHRRSRALGHRAVAERAAFLRYPADRGQHLSLYRALSQARAGSRRADRSRRRAHRAALSGRMRPARRRLRHAAALLPRLHAREDCSFLEGIQKGVGKWRARLKEQGELADTPMKPQVVAYELNKLLPDDAVITTDSGTNTSWAARFLDMRGDMKFAVSGNLATMACGLPYAIAAALAYPERKIVAFVGDGGLSMLMAELATCARLALNVTIIVIKNNSLGQIKWEQMVFLGNPEYGCELHPIDFAGVAQACGLRGYTIADPSTCAATLREALSGGPALVEAAVDPNEPPMPPKVTFEQTRHLVEALARGTPAAGKIMRNIASEAIRELV